MKPGNPRHNFSNRSWAGESGLAVIQWIGLGAVTLVAAVAIITVFVAGGGGAEVRQAVDSGTTARVDCLDSNCEHWDYKLSGAQPSSVRPPRGEGLPTAGDVVAGPAIAQDPQDSKGPSPWDRFWDGVKALPAKVGSAVSDWWNGLPSWAKGLIVGIAAAVVIVVAVVLLVAVGVLALTATVVIAAVLAIVAAIAAGVWYGINHPQDFNILAGFGLSLGAGTLTFLATLAAAVVLPKIGAWIANTAFPWLTNVLWPTVSGAVSSVWTGLKALVLARWKITLAQIAAYVVSKVFIIDLGFQGHFSTSQEYAIDILGIVVGSLFAPVAFGMKLLWPNLLWSGGIATIGQVLQQVRAQGWNPGRWDAVTIVAAVAVAVLAKWGLTKTTVSGDIGAAVERTARIWAGWGIKQLRQLVGASTPAASPALLPTNNSLPAPVPTPNPTSKPTPTNASRPHTAPTNISQPAPAPVNRPAPVPTPANVARPQAAPTNISQPAPAPVNRPAPVPTPANIARPQTAPTNISLPAPAPVSRPAPVPTPTNVSRPQTAPTNTPHPAPVNRPTSEPAHNDENLGNSVRPRMNPKP